MPVNKLKIETNMAGVKKTAAVVAIAISIAGALWGTVQAATYYQLDQRYVKVSDYVQSKKDERIDFLQDQIFILTFKVTNGEAKPLDKAILVKYQNELLKLTQ